MRFRLAGAVLLSAAAYYVYLPLPSGVSEPWKLMLLDALFRSFMQASDVAHTLGLCHRVHVLNQVVSWVEVIEAHSCSAVHVTDSTLGGVPTRVFQPKGGGERLKRGVIYFHGGGWAHVGVRCKEDRKGLTYTNNHTWPSRRLAPEAVFPDQYHDALAASRAFLSSQVLERYGIDPQRVCVSGDSAGGNLAAAASLCACSSDPVCKLQR